MTELDDLRQALHSPPGFAPRALDLDAIMVSGGRLRTRRRIVASATAALSVVAVLIGGGLWAGHNRSAGSDPVAPAGPGPVATPRPTDGADPTPGADPALSERPLGDVIRTRMKSGAAEWVLYGVGVQDPQVPQTHFGFMLGRQRSTGAPVSTIMIDETQSSDRATGFHQGEGASNVDGADTPAFAYFSGPAARIIGSVNGRLRTAHQARWSEDQQIVVFWFDLTDVPAGAVVTKLTAYDSAGRPLATRTNGFGVG